MKQWLFYSILVIVAMACQKGEPTNEDELTDDELEEMDQKVDDIIQEDQERYDSMKKELGL